MKLRNLMHHLQKIALRTTGGSPKFGEFPWEAAIIRSDNGRYVASRVGGSGPRILADG